MTPAFARIGKPRNGDSGRSKGCGVRTIRAALSLLPAAFAWTACSEAPCPPAISPATVRTTSSPSSAAPLSAVDGAVEEAPPVWTDFRGPGRQGISYETGLLPEWPEGGPPLVWIAESLGRGYGSLTFDEARGFVQGTADDRSCVFALNRDDGSLLWKTPVAEIYSSDRGVGPNSTPVVDGDSVYALSENGTLVRLQASNGAIVWSLSFTGTFDSEIPYYGYSESPLVRDGVVYAMPGGRAGAVVALRTEDGRRLWSSRELPDAASYCSLVPAAFDGMDVLLGYTAASAFGISPQDGRVLFQTSESVNRTANAAAPLVAPPHVLYSTSYSAGGSLLVEFYRAGDRLLAEKVYFERKLKNHFGGLVHRDGYVYGSSGNILTCMRLADGHIEWSQRGLGRSFVVLAEGLLYVYNDAGGISLVEARPDDFRLRSRMQLEKRGAFTFSLGCPVILDRRLYLRDTDRVYCFDIAA